MAEPDFRQEPIPTARRLGVLLLLCTVLVGAPTLTFALLVLVTNPSPDAQVPEVLQSNDPGRAFGGAVVMLLLSGFCLALGLPVWGLTWLTQGFVSNVAQPVWSRFNLRAGMIDWVMMLAMFMPLAAPPVAVVGLLLTVAFGVPRWVAFDLLFVRFGVPAACYVGWQDVYSTIARNLMQKRLAFRGIAVDVDGGPTWVGVGKVENRTGLGGLRQYPVDDYGLLRMTEDYLLFHGDADLAIHRRNLLQVLRYVDTSDTAAYFGSRDVVLIFYDDQGLEQMVRLTVIAGNATRQARQLDELAKAIEAWRTQRTPLVTSAEVSPLDATM